MDQSPKFLVRTAGVWLRNPSLTSTLVKVNKLFFVFLASSPCLPYPLCYFFSFFFFKLAHFIKWNLILKWNSHCYTWKSYHLQKKKKTKPYKRKCIAIWKKKKSNVYMVEDHLNYYFEKCAPGDSDTDTFLIIFGNTSNRDKKTFI